MVLKWDDVFFEERAEEILDILMATDEEREAILDEWSQEMFELDQIVYRGNEKYILDGREGALSTLQRIAKRHVLKRIGVQDRSLELAQAQRKIT